MNKNAETVRFQYLNNLYGYLNNDKIDAYEFPEVEDEEYKRIVGMIIQLRNRLITPDDLNNDDLVTIVEILAKI